MIAILCPSKGRAKLCNRMIQSAYNTTSEKISVYVAVSAEEFNEYKQTIKIPESNRFNVVLAEMPDCPTVHRWNRLAELAMMEPTTSYFMLGSDDIVFGTPLWDRELMASYSGKPHVYHLQDSRDKDGTPHVICTREYIEAMGFFLPPIFLHWVIDTWTVEIAKANNCFTHLTDYLLEHVKPSDSGRPDETHLKIRRDGWHKRDMWLAKVSGDILDLYKERLRQCLKKN